MAVLKIPTRIGKNATSKLLILAVAAGLTGCASMSAGLGYEKRSATPTQRTTKVADSYPSALENTRPLSLSVSKEYVGAIQEGDATLRTDAGSARYKVFRLPDSFSNLSVKSLCSCFGFKKRIMPPAGLLLDEAGDLIGAPLEFANGTNSWLPIHYEAKVESADVPDDTKFLLVASDPRQFESGGISSEAVAITPIPLVIPIGIKFAETGELRIKVK